MSVSDWHLRGTHIDEVTRQMLALELKALHVESLRLSRVLRRCCEVQMIIHLKKTHHFYVLLI